MRRRPRDGSGCPCLSFSASPHHEGHWRQTRVRLFGCRKVSRCSSIPKFGRRRERFSPSSALRPDPNWTCPLDRSPHPNLTRTLFGTFCLRAATISKLQQSGWRRRSPPCSKDCLKSLRPKRLECQVQEQLALPCSVIAGAPRRRGASSLRSIRDGGSKRPASTDFGAS